jgi:CBS domain-containing protein
MEKIMFALDVMDTAPVVLSPDESIAEAARKFMDRRYRSLPVVDENHKFLGVVTVSIMLKIVLPKAATMSGGVSSLTYVNVTFPELWQRFLDASNDRVADHMKTNPITVTPNTSLLETLLLVYKEKINLPVVDSDTGRLEGMISYYDIGDRILESGHAGVADAG